MVKFWGPFLIGSGMALLLLSVALYVQIKPIDGKLNDAKTDIAALYEFTHSGSYASVSATLASINSIFGQMAQMPLIGDGCFGRKYLRIHFGRGFIANQVKDVIRGAD